MIISPTITAVMYYLLVTTVLCITVRLHESAIDVRYEESRRDVGSLLMDAIESYKDGKKQSMREDPKALPSPDVQEARRQGWVFQGDD